MFLPLPAPPTYSPATAGTVPEAWVRARCQWPHVLAELHLKPTCFGPIVIEQVEQTRLFVQLAGTMHVGITRHGSRQQHQSRPGSVYLTAAQQATYELDWQGQPGEAIQSIELDLDDNLLRQTATAAGIEAASLELPTGVCPDALLLRQLAYSLAATLQAPGPADALYADTVARMLAAQLVHQLVGRTRVPSAPAGRLDLARLRLVQDYVRDSLDQAITLANLAAVACVSPYHFCHLFRQATGLSPHQYVIGQRLDQAKYLLEHRDWSIAQVAQAVGYRSGGHFARLFQRHTGGLPTEVRRPH